MKLTSTSKSAPVLHTGTSTSMDGCCKGLAGFVQLGLQGCGLNPAEYLMLLVLGSLIKWIACDVLGAYGGVVSAAFVVCAAWFFPFAHCGKGLILLGDLRPQIALVLPKVWIMHLSSVPNALCTREEVC